MDEPDPADETATPAPPGDDRAAWWRFALVLLLAAAVAVVAWRGRPAAGDADGPEGVFLHIRDRALAGDGDAMWLLLSDDARESYSKWIGTLRGNPDDAMAVRFREFTGLSAAELEGLTPRRIHEREVLAAAGTIYGPGQIVKVDRRDEDTAVLYMFLAERGEKQWHLELVDGRWIIQDLNPFVRTQDGSLVEKLDPEPR